MEKFIIANSSEIVTCSGFSAKKGKEMSNIDCKYGQAIVINHGVIEDIGEQEAILSKYNEGYEVLDVTGKCVMPGFVDSHTHLVFGGYRAEEFSWRLAGKSYMEIMEKGGGIVNSVSATAEASEEELYDSAFKRLNSMMRFGVTTVEGKSGYGLDKDTELKQLRVMKTLNKNHCLDIVPTFLGAHAVPKEFKGREDEFVDWMIEDVMPEVVSEGLAEFCDVFCEKNVFEIEPSRKLLVAAKEMGLKLKLHADEIVQLGGAELAAELGAVSADHLLKASDKGIKDMAEKGVITTLLPATAFSLKEPYADARKMIDSNCSLALASDMNPGSCYTESIPLIISLATLYMNMSIEETISALTINGAAALDRAKEIGSIDIGKKADIIVLENESYKYLPYHIGVSIVEKVIKNGKVIYSK